MEHIDLHAILRARISGWKRFLIPSALISMLENVVHQDELNIMLDATKGTEGSEFAEALYNHLNISIDVKGEENIPDSGKFIFVSNHPLGGLDGIGLIKILGKKYHDDSIRVLVNDMLMHVYPLKNVFLPINKYGSQGRSAAAAINKAFESDRQILIFPAGLVSRLQPDGSIKDLKWQKAFIKKALDYNRDIIPVRFDGLNRARFYQTAKWRKKLGLKVNIEQALLPAELCAARNNKFSVTFGKPISHNWIADKIANGNSADAIAEAIKKIVYNL